MSRGAIFPLEKRRRCKSARALLSEVGNDFPSSEHFYPKLIGSSRSI